MNATYSITEYKKVQILSVNALLDEWQNRQILKELQRNIDISTSNFVLDLGQLNILNSAGINFILSLYKNVQKNNGDLILVNASKRIFQILDITRLSSVFTIKNSIESAVQCFNLKLAA